MNLVAKNNTRGLSSTYIAFGKQLANLRGESLIYFPRRWLWVASMLQLVCTYHIRLKQISNVDINTQAVFWGTIYSVSQKSPPPGGLQFSDIFSQTLENFKSILAVRRYARYAIATVKQWLKWP